MTSDLRQSPTPIPSPPGGRGGTLRQTSGLPTTAGDGRLDPAPVGAGPEGGPPGRIFRRAA